MQKDKNLTPEDLQKVIADALAGIPAQKPAPLMVEVRGGSMAVRGREDLARSDND